MTEGGGDGVPVAVLAAALQRANQLISIVDDTGRIVYVNDKFRDYGYTPDDVIGSEPLDFVHPDDLARAEVGITILDQSTFSVPMGFRLRRPDGTYESIHVGSTLVEVDGRPWFVFDMTPVPFHNMTAEALAALAAGGRAEDALEVLADGLTETMQVGLVASVALDTPNGRTSIGPLEPELAGVVGGEQQTRTDTPWGAALATGEVVSDVGLPDDLPELRARADALGFQAVSVFPIEDPGADLPATLVVWHRDTYPRELIDMFLATVPVDIVRVALRGRHHRRELEHQATCDALTGLANRRAFFTALDRLTDERRVARAATDLAVAVLYVDLDDFKPVNDHHGHDTGDQVLEELGRRFRAAVRPDDLVARLGGDEFAVLCAGISHTDEALAVANRLAAVAAEPLDTLSGRVGVGASVGVAYLDDHGGADLRTLLSSADEALLRAKRARKGTVELAVIT